MIEIKEVLRRWQAGHGEPKIGRDTGIDRKTVGRYIRWALELGVDRTREPTNGDVHAVALRGVDVSYATPRRYAMQRAHRSWLHDHHQQSRHRRVDQHVRRHVARSERC